MQILYPACFLAGMKLVDNKDIGRYFNKKLIGGEDVGFDISGKCWV